MSTTLERIHRVREDNKDKEVVTLDKKYNLLIEFVNQNNKQPKLEEIYKDVKVGKFWNNIKKGCGNNLYKKYVETNIILKTEYERIQQVKEENKDLPMYVIKNMISSYNPISPDEGFAKVISL